MCLCAGRARGCGNAPLRASCARREATEVPSRCARRLPCPPVPLAEAAGKAQIPSNPSGVRHGCWGAGGWQSPALRESTESLWMCSMHMGRFIGMHAFAVLNALKVLLPGRVLCI